MQSECYARSVALVRGNRSSRPDPLPSLAMRIHAALALALPLAAPAAFAQLQTTSVLSLGGTDTFTDVEFTVPVPGGGVLTCFATSATTFGPATVTLARVDEAGREVWRRSDPAALRAGKMGSLRVTPGGSFLLCTQDSNAALYRSGELLSIAPSGELEWSMWPESVITGPFLGRVAGFSQSGDIYLEGYSRGMDGLSVLLIAAGTGAELWRIERPGVSVIQYLDNLHASSAGGDLFIAYNDGAGSTGLRIDPAGQVVYEQTGILASVFGRALMSIVATPSGELFVAESDNSVGASFQSRVTCLDPTGAVRWRESETTQSEIIGIRPMDDGGVTVGYRRTGGRVRRLDANGNLVWQRVGPVGATRLRGFEVGTGDAVTAVYETATSAGSIDGVQVVRYGVGGAVLGSHQLESTSLLPSSTVRNAAVSTPDARGNTWVTYESVDAGVPQDVAVARLVLDEAEETIECTQSTPNSTGERGRLSALGSPAAGRNNLTLVADRMPAAQSVLFLVARQSGFTPNPGGSAGDLCLGPPLARYVANVLTSDLAGRAALQLDLTRIPEGAGTVAALAGETRFWQAWHREPGGGSHLTSAISVTLD